tara:strand:- start:1062 stop:1238 length:177 start_codon:yes stop_codon:yes gene_type:complete
VKILSGRGAGDGIRIDRHDQQTLRERKMKRQTFSVFDKEGATGLSSGGERSKKNTQNG